MSDPKEAGAQLRPRDELQTQIDGLVSAFMSGASVQVRDLVSALSEAAERLRDDKIALEGELERAHFVLRAVRLSEIDDTDRQWASGAAKAIFGNDGTADPNDFQAVAERVALLHPTVPVETEAQAARPRPGFQHPTPPDGLASSGEPLSLEDRLPTRDQLEEMGFGDVISVAPPSQGMETERDRLLIIKCHKYNIDTAEQLDAAFTRLRAQPHPDVSGPDEQFAENAKCPSVRGLLEAFIVDEEEGPVTGILVELPDGQQIWSGECSDQTFNEQAEEVREGLGFNSGTLVLRGMPDKSIQVLCKAADVEIGIEIVRALGRQTLAALQSHKGGEGDSELAAADNNREAK
jgi:hypothetical protein